MKKRLNYCARLLFLLCWIAILISGCRSVEEADNTVSLATIKITPSITSLGVGQTAQLSAAKLYTDSSSIDCSSEAVWSSSNTTVATFSSTTNGLLTAVGAGTTTILVTCSGASKSDALTVQPLTSITITPANSSIPIGINQQLTATGTFSDGSTADITQSVEWSSADPSSVIVGNSSISGKGLTRGLATGTIVITAALGSLSTSTNLTISAVTLERLEVAPINKTIANTTKLIVVATGIFSDSSVLDLTDAVTWTSTNPDNVSLERSNGSGSVQATAKIDNTSETITARYGTVTGSTVINVSNAVALSAVIVTPEAPVLAVDARLYIGATGLFSDNTVQEITDFVNWSSSNAAVAIVSNVNNGVTDALSVGSATITADMDGTSDSVTLTVSSAVLDSVEVFPPIQSMTLGSSLKFIAIGIYSDNTIIDLTKQITWSASDSELLNVENTPRSKGRATALELGTVYLSASLPGSTKGASAVITISDLALAAIEVTPKDPQFAANLDVNFKAVGVFSDGTTQDLTDSAVWSSSDENVLKINNASQFRGLSRSLATGTTVITAAFGSSSGTSSATISAATLSSLQITPPNSSLAVGFKRQLTATGIYSDNSSFDLTPYVSWQSSSAAAVVDNIIPFQGLAAAAVAGSAPTITASFNGMDGQDTAVIATTNLTTTNATLNAIEISPINPFCVKGIDVQFNATGIFSDNTTLDMTSFVVWKSSNILVSSANNAARVRGHFQCEKSGTTDISAMSGGTTGTTVLTVIEPGATQR